jgi:hypothetical protein
MIGNWKANGALRVDNCYIWCHSYSLSGLERCLIDFIIIYSLVYILLFQISCKRRQMATRTYTPISSLSLSHTPHCSFNKFTIVHIPIRDWNQLPLFLCVFFDWSSSSQGASIFKRCFVACRHSSIEQKHAHDGPMNNTMMREIVPAVVRYIACLNCLMSLPSIWRAPSIFQDKICSYTDTYMYVSNKKWIQKWIVQQGTPG